MPKDVKDRDWKLGNPNYPAYTLDRELSETEKVHLFALYQRRDHDVKAAAEALKIDEEVAHTAIMECLRSDPDALNDPDHSLRLSHACDQVIVRGLMRVIQNIEEGKLYGQGLINTVKVATWLQRDFLKHYKAAGADKDLADTEADIDAKIKEMEARIAASKRAGDEEAVPETAPAPGATEPTETVGGDAGPADPGVEVA